MKYKEVKKHILKFLRKRNAWLTRDEIKKVLRIPRSTLFDCLIQLNEEGKIEKKIEDRKVKGRPFTYWRIYWYRG